MLLSGCSFSSAQDQLPTITSHETRRVPIYTSSSNVNPDDSLIIHHFNDSCVGYFALDAVNSLLNNQLSMFQSSTKGTTTTITNGLGSCTVDFAAQTVTYSNYDGYSVYDINSYASYIDGLTKGGKPFFVNTLTRSTYQAAPDYTIKFRDYSIPLYFEDGVGYVPLETVFPFFYPVNSLSLFYNGEAVYTYNVTLTNLRPAFSSTKSSLTREYMRYNYNLFAMQLDERFGLDQKILVPGSTEAHKYLAKDAYTLLEPYRERMLSLDPNSYDEAMFEFFAKELDDGGHTTPTSFSGLIDANMKTTYGSRIRLGWDRKEALKAARSEKGYDPAQIVSAQLGKETSATASYQEINGVGYFTFDHFVCAEEKPTYVNIDNYYENTINQVAFVNQVIRQHGTKNLVIDLSCNGGGDAVAEQFIASWLCGGVSTVLRNTIDKSYSIQTNYADVNFDGVFDENDVLPSDVNVYCITSICSFSCGNLLAWHLKEQRKTTFLGEKTGGGSCIVDSSNCLAYGFSYQSSGRYQIGSLSSTSYDDFLSVEEGVSPDIPFSTETADLGAFYDRPAIVSNYVLK